MKTAIILILATIALLNTAHAQKGTSMTPAVMTDEPAMAPPPPMPPFEVPGDSLVPLPPRASAPPPAPAPAFVFEQSLYGAAPALMPPQEAQIIVDQFRSNYAKLGSPRILIYVNRELVNEHSGLKLSARKETVDTTRTSGNAGSGSNATDSVTTHSVADNTYSNNGKAAPTLADRQTVRDVERLMGQPMRAAGASLVDQRVAAQLIGDRPLDSVTPENEQARRDREAVSKIADVVVEVLMTSRKVTVTEVSGDKTYSVPDIQATAIRLKDAKVIGQASAADAMNKAGGAGMIARNYGVEDITEATALSLMDDMSAEAK